MDLSLTENQEMLKNTARELVQREYPTPALLELDGSERSCSAEQWERLAGVGWPGIVIPREYGGEGSSLTDAAVLFQELGRGPVPSPLFSSSILGAMLVLEGGTESQKRQVLPAVARGATVLATAVTESDYGWAPESVRMTASRKNGSLVLDGTKLFVPEAASATHFLCAARLGRDGDYATDVSFILVDANEPRVSVRSLPGFTAWSSEVKFDSVEVDDSMLLGEQPGQGWGALERAMATAIPVLCAYQVGGCEAVFDMSVTYSQERVQFGVPIGRFQRVQDHIINLVNHLDAARWSTYEALWKLDTARPAAGSMHMAKAVASEAYYQACNYAHEVHAGVGVMQEYGLTLHTKMSRNLYHYLGDPRYHKRRLAEALEL